MTPKDFMLLVSQGELRAAEKALASEPSLAICRTGSYEQTAVHYAAFRNQVHMLSLLKRFGASLDAMNKRGETPIYEAFTSGAYDAIHTLIELGADPNIVAGGKGQTPLHLAIRIDERPVELTQALLAQGAKVNVLSEAGSTPLALAVQFKQERCVVALLEHGADPNLRMDGGLPSAMERALRSAKQGKGRMLDLIQAWCGAQRAHQVIGEVEKLGSLSDHGIKPLAFRSHA